MQIFFVKLVGDKFQVREVEMFSWFVGHEITSIMWKCFDTTVVKNISIAAVYETLITDFHVAERLTFNEGSH
jgi:hypothetical protein